MKTLQTLTVSFCLAGICAETVTLLTGPGWPRRCIKALAGLYILVVFLRIFSGTGARRIQTDLPVQAPVSIQDTEGAVLAQAEEQLEKNLEAACKERFGKKAALSIALEQNEQEVCVSHAEMRIPLGESAASYAEAAEYLRQQLGAEVEIVTGEENQE